MNQNKLKQLLQHLVRNQRVIKSALEEHEHNDRGLAISDTLFKERHDVWEYIVYDDVEDIFEKK